MKFEIESVDEVVKPITEFFLKVPFLKKEKRIDRKSSSTYNLSWWDLIDFDFLWLLFFFVFSCFVVEIHYTAEKDAHTHTPRIHCLYREFLKSFLFLITKHFFGEKCVEDSKSYTITRTQKIDQTQKFV